MTPTYIMHLIATDHLNPRYSKLNIIIENIHILYGENSPFSERGTTALLLAVQAMNFNLVNALLKIETEKSKINAKDNSGETPLVSAINLLDRKSNETKITEQIIITNLLNHGADYHAEIPHDKKSILDKAIEEKNNFLMTEIANAAAQNGDITTLNKLLIDNGSSFQLGKYGKRNLLFCASKNGRDNVVQWLLDHQYITVDNIKNQNIIYGHTVLLAAAQGGQHAFVQWLLENCYITVDDIKNQKDQSEFTILLKAACAGQYAFVQWLLEKEYINVDDIKYYKDKRGYTALLSAAFYDHHRFVQWLLDNRYITVDDIKNQKNNSGNTVLLCAVDSCHDAFILWLLEKEPSLLFERDSNNRNIIKGYCQGHSKIHDPIKQFISTYLIKHHFESFYEEIAWIDLCENEFESLFPKIFLLENKIACFQRWNKLEQARMLCQETMNSSSSINECKSIAMQALAEIIFNDDSSDNDLITRATHAYEFICDLNTNAAQKLKVTFHNIFQGLEFSHDHYRLENNNPWLDEALNIFTSYYMSANKKCPASILYLIITEQKKKFDSRLFTINQQINQQEKQIEIQRKQLDIQQKYIHELEKQMLPTSPSTTTASATFFSCKK